MKVGFIGIGLMGQHMVKHIIKSGHDLVVYDIGHRMWKKSLWVRVEY